MRCMTLTARSFSASLVPSSVPYASIALMSSVRRNSTDVAVLESRTLAPMAAIACVASTPITDVLEGTGPDGVSMTPTLGGRESCLEGRFDGLPGVGVRSPSLSSAPGVLLVRLRFGVGVSAGLVGASCADVFIDSPSGARTLFVSKRQLMSGSCTKASNMAMTESLLLRKTVTTLSHVLRKLPSMPLTSIALTSMRVSRKGTFSGNFSRYIDDSKQSPKSM